MKFFVYLIAIVLGFVAIAFVALFLYALYAGIAAFFFYIPRG